MSIYNFVYKKVAKSKGIIRSQMWRIIYEKLKKIKDPIIKYPINGQQCFMKFSHEGAIYMTKYKNYDKNLKYLSEYVKEKKNRALNIIDVGANIGDTVLNIGDKENKYLLVEGVETYSKFISRNLKDYNYKLINTFLSDYNENVGVDVAVEHGTGRLKESTGNTINTRRLDEIIENAEFAPDIFKIDTDGYDFKVIRGAKNMISRYLPIIYFEWTLPELIECGENPLSIFDFLNNYGYKKGIVFDNFGNIVCRFNTGDVDLLGELINYTRKGTIYYYDILLICEKSDYKIGEIYNKLIEMQNKIC